MGWRSNTASEQTFPAVPRARFAKKGRSSREQNRGWMPKPDAADHGIKPDKSAPKTLYALQSCYEGSPSQPRGAIVGGRRFADDRAEQTDPSRRPRSPARCWRHRRARPRRRDAAISSPPQPRTARGGGDAGWSGAGAGGGRPPPEPP